MPVGADDLERVYRAEFTTMAQTAAGILNDAQAGADVVQSAFVKALDKLSTFRGHGNLSAWVWAIVVNEARSAMRRAPATVFHDEVATEDAYSATAQVAEIRERIAALPERQRTAIFLRYYADLPNTQIAQLLGIRPGTVGALLSQGHAALRTILREVVE